MHRIPRKKILLLVPTLQLGGQERVAVNTAEVLKELYDVTIVIFDHRNAAYDTDCEIINLNLPSVPGKIQKVLNALRRALRLNRLKKERAATITISFGGSANLINILSGGTGKKVIRLTSYGQSAWSALKQVVYWKSDQIICCSKVTGTQLIDVFPQYQNKIHYIPNPFHVQTLLEMGSASVKDYSFSPHTIISHGRLDIIKNYPRLIKAFSLVKQEIPDAQLLIIGEGPMREKLQQLIVQYELDNYVKLLGFRHNPFAYLSKASVYVLSSYTEGFPNSLVEGMVFLPAIAVDCLSGPREILSNGTLDVRASGVEFADYGILVPSAEEITWNSSITKEDRLLAEGLLSLLTNPQRLHSMKEQASIRARAFSFEAYRTAIVQIIEE